MQEHIFQLLYYLILIVLPLSSATQHSMTWSNYDWCKGSCHKTERYQHPYLHANSIHKQAVISNNMQSFFHCCLDLKQICSNRHAKGHSLTGFPTASPRLSERTCKSRSVGVVRAASPAGEGLLLAWASPDPPTGPQDPWGGKGPGGGPNARGLVWGSGMCGVANVWPRATPQGVLSVLGGSSALGG